MRVTMILGSTFIMVVASTFVRERHLVSDTVMESVTVFADRAEVTRSITLPASGVSALHVTLVGFPSSLEAGSVRSVRGDTALTLIDSQERTWIHESPEAIARRRAAEERESRGLALLHMARNNVSRLQYMRRKIDELVTARSVDRGQGLKQINECLDWYEKSAAPLDDQLVEANDALASLETAAGEVRKAAQEAVEVTTRVVEMHFVVAGIDSGTRQLSFKYTVHGASWEPAYDLQLRVDTEGLVNLEHYAIVKQSTGEDWSNVRMRLSSGDASHTLSPPRARQRHVYDDTLAGLDNTRGGEQAPAPAVGVVLQTPHAITVPSDGEKHRLHLATAELPTSLTHFVAPKESPHAYLRARMLNPGPYPLLPSTTMRVISKDGFAMTTTLSGVVGVNTHFTSFLGIDADVRVVVNAETRHTQEGKIPFFSHDVITFASSVRLVNAKRDRLRIIVQDAVVQSFSNKVTVDILDPAHGKDLISSQAEADPAQLKLCKVQAHLNNRTGAVTWGAVLGSEEDGSCRELTIPLVFTVTAPKDSARWLFPSFLHATHTWFHSISGDGWNSVF